MTRNIIRRDEAQRDLLRYFVYLGRDSPRTATRFLRAAEQTIHQLARTRGLGAPWESTNPTLEGLRVYPVKKFPQHLIFFLPFDDRIEIVRVLHGAQDLELVFGAE